MRAISSLLTSLAVSILISGCRQAGSTDAKSPAPDLLRAALVPVSGDQPIDAELARAQEAVRAKPDDAAALERLGTLWIAKARSTHDAGLYKLAEQVALALQRQPVGSASGLLLHGHVLHSLHKFAEAEGVARAAVARRGLFLDHGLLGDVLYDRGRVAEALASYQSMLDLKPCLQSYVRAAQVRWLRGDPAEAKQLLALASGSGNVRDPEALAWTHARLAHVELQLGDLQAAAEQVERGLGWQATHVAVRMAQVRLRTARGERAGALESAERAAEPSGDVEARWALADCLRELGRTSEAAAVEAELERTGAGDDPRTFALYLATRGKDMAQAEALARAELAARQDVLTHDALAFALARAGRGHDEARQELQKALAEGTQDARLFVHAAAVCAAAGARDECSRHRERAKALGATLLPSERLLLESLSER